MKDIMSIWKSNFDYIDATPVMQKVDPDSVKQHEEYWIEYEEVANLLVEQQKMQEALETIVRLDVSTPGAVHRAIKLANEALKKETQE